MAVVAASAFFIHEIRTFGPFSPIHLLSIYVLATLPPSLMLARRGRIEAHRRAMLGMFLGALIVAGALTFLPGRVMHAVLFAR
jgi:uncharacterized membrane protein